MNKLFSHFPFIEGFPAPAVTELFESLFAFSLLYNRDEAKAAIFGTNEDIRETSVLAKYFSVSCIMA